MDKNTIKIYLSEKFVNEVTTPAVTLNNKIRKDNAKINKKGVSSEAKDSLDYNKSLKQDKETSKMAPNKFNYNTEEKTYHEEMEIMNGQEMIQYDNEPTEEFTKKAKEAIEGSSRMGNEGGKKIGNAEETWGASSDEFGKNLVKKIKSSVKKRNEQTPTTISLGDDWETTKSKSAKPRAIQENIDEMAVAPKPIPEKLANSLKINIEKYGADKTAEKLIDAASETKMVSHMPDSREYGEGKNKVSALLSAGKLEQAVQSARTLAKKIEKKAMKDMGMFENKNPLIGKSIVVKNHGKYEGEIGKIIDIPNIGNAVTAMMDDGKKAIITRSDFEVVSENKNDNKTKTKKMKKITFENEFKSVGHALKLIPEHLKINNNVFVMTDGNKTFTVRWEGSLTEGKAAFLSAEDKTLVNEDILRMKQLFNYKSQDTLGLVKGNARLDENRAFSDVWAKTRALMTESEDIESAKADEGNWEEETKTAPEAKKHIQGTVSKDKGTQAPKAKEGNVDKAVSQAPEAKKHVESGSGKKASTAKPKEGNWEDVKGGEKMMEIEAPIPKEGHWEDISVPQAAEAKKHVHLKESDLSDEESKELKKQADAHHNEYKLDEEFDEEFDIMNEEPMDVNEMMEKMMNQEAEEAEEVVTEEENEEETDEN